LLCFSYLNWIRTIIFPNSNPAIEPIFAYLILFGDTGPDLQRFSNFRSGNKRLLLEAMSTAALSHSLSDAMADAPLWTLGAP
jgi:hypothetical protein